MNRLTTPGCKGPRKHLPPLDSAYFNQSKVIELLNHFQAISDSLSALGKTHVADYHKQAAKEALGSARLHLEEVEYRLIEEARLTDLTASSKGINAQKAFAVPEILEMILIKLSMKDLLAVPLVCRQFNALVERSLPIRRRLLLVPGPHFSFALEGGLSLQGTYTHIFPAGQHPWQNVADRKQSSIAAQPHLQDIFITTKSGFRWDLTAEDIGMRGRSMLICTPPVYDVQVFAKCCPHLDNSVFMNRVMRQEQALISNKAGVTVGDLLSAALKVTEQHKWCPNAPFDALRADGKVNVDITFKMRATLQEDDPATQNSRRELQGVATTHTSLTRYFEAKNKAVSRGEGVPTFGEYIASLDAKGLDFNNGNESVDDI